MSHIERLQWGEVEPRIQRIFETLHEARGNVPNLFRVMGRRPSLLTSFNVHFGAVMGEGEVDVRLKELLAVRVSQLNDCEY
jgi:alkylhydroperoxidase family enzyme